MQKSKLKRLKRVIEKIVERKLEEIDINDPVLMKSRSSISKSKKAAEIDWEDLEWELDDINQEIKDLKLQRKTIFQDQDLAAGEKGEEWTDDDANEYGEELNKIEDELARLKARKSEIESMYDERFYK